MPSIHDHHHRGIPSTSSPTLRWAAAILVGILLAVLCLTILVRHSYAPGRVQQPAAPVVGYDHDDDVDHEIKVKIKHEGPRVIAPSPMVRRTTGAPSPSPRMTLSKGTAGRSTAGRTTVRKSR